MQTNRPSVAEFVAPFDFELPESQIATEPLAKRDDSRLLILDRKTGHIQHKSFHQLDEFLTATDVLVLNNSKVFPARLRGKKSTGGEVECLLLYPLTANQWQAISRPGLAIGTIIHFSELTAQVVAKDEEKGEVIVEFDQGGTTLDSSLNKLGQTPIPHYIDTALDEQSLRQRYQTVYAKDRGSVAAPTAGLHFTPELLKRLTDKGIQIEYVTLHVGLGTFQSIRPEHITSKSLHSEWYSIDQLTADRLNAAKAAGKRIIAVGTTSTRTLESAFDRRTNTIQAGSSTTQLFIDPGFQFNVVDALITNFHLPKSSLLMLVSAFSSTPNTAFEFDHFRSSTVGKAYLEAIKKSYRFYSFGDAMFIK